MRFQILLSGVLAGLAVAHVVQRDGTCAPQALGSGPVASPDTPEAFLGNPELQNFALNAPTPSGYYLIFSNLKASLSAGGYMGLHTLTSYDTNKCQSLCDEAAGCVAFNIYSERDPTLDPNAADCPNPPSTTNFKCTLYGATVSSAQANNFGQWRDSFEVVIAGSNAYSKIPPSNCDNPATCSGMRSCGRGGCVCQPDEHGAGYCNSGTLCNRLSTCSTIADCPGGSVCLFTCCYGGTQGVCMPVSLKCDNPASPRLLFARSKKRDTPGCTAGPNCSLPDLTAA